MPSFFVTSSTLGQTPRTNTLLVVMLSDRD